MSALPELREYQKAAVESLRLSLAKGMRRPVLVSPTGSGKTRLAIEVIRLAVSKGRRVLFLAPRRELIYQASAVLESAGVMHGVIMAGEPAHRYSPVQVASFDTLWARRNRIPLPPADLVIVDEAHLSLAATRKKLIEAYPDARVIGLTATPARGDGRGLGEIYDDLVLSWSVRELTDAGFLVPARYFVPTKPDLEGLKINRDGDYREKELAPRMDQPQLIGDIVHNWFRLAKGRSTVVFCVTRSHSRHLQAEFVARGVKAEHLDGETELAERQAILARVASGETTVLCNVFVATYGLDIPRLECAVLARPTRNIALYLQIIGRVLRTAPGKTEALVIDHAGAVDEHGRVDDYVPWSLDEDSKVSERKKADEQERKEPKDITCGECSYVFRASRKCPKCGHEMVSKGKPVPVHQADLQELKPSQENKNATWEAKAEFMAGLRAYALERGINPGWCAHKYREKFGVWPNDRRVSAVPPGPIAEEVRNWIRHSNIRFAKGRAAA